VALPEQPIRISGCGKFPFVARFSPRLEVIDSSGVVVAREGDGLRKTRRSVRLNELHVCPHHYFDVRGSERLFRWVGNDPGSAGR